MFSHLSLHRLSSWRSCWRRRFQLSEMAAGGSERRSDEDPWKVSAFISAFTGLLLSLLLLLAAAIAFITSLFVKYFGLEPPCSYIGCSHPGHTEFSRRQRYPFPSSCAHEFSVNNLCPDCDLFRSCPNFQSENIDFKDDRHDEDVSQTLEEEDSSSRGHNAPEGDKDCGRKRRPRKNALYNHPNAYLVCAHCNHPLRSSVNQHTFMKRAVDKERYAHCRPYMDINDGRSVGAVSRRAFTEDDLPLFSAKPVFADGNSSDIEEDSENSSSSADSMKDLCLEKQGRSWTRFTCVFEETSRNTSEATFRDSEGDSHASLQGERLDSAVKDVDHSQSLPFCGFERDLVQPTDNCPYLSGEEFKRAEVSANNTDRFVNAVDALSAEPVAFFQPEKNIHEPMRQIDNEFVVKRSLQRESAEERGDLIAENTDALQKQGEEDRIVVVSKCSEVSILEGASTGKHTFDRDEMVDTGTIDLACLEKVQDICGQEHIFEVGKVTDLADSRDHIGQSGSLQFKALGKIPVSDKGEDLEGYEELAIQNPAQCEDIVGKVERVTALENTWKAGQLRDSIGEGALEGSEDLCQMGKNVEVDLEGPLNPLQQRKDMGDLALKGTVDLCQLQKADLLEGMTEVSSVIFEAMSQQNLLHADHSDALQLKESSKLNKLEESTQQEGDGWFWDLSQREQFLNVAELGSSHTGTLKECQDVANSEQENDLAECEGCGILETHPASISMDDNDRLTGKKSVIKHHMGEAEQGQNIGGLDAQQGELGLEPCLAESEPDPGTDSNDCNEGDTYVFNGAKNKLLNMVLCEASDLQDISGKKRGKNPIGEKVSQQQGINVLVDESHHNIYLDPTGEFNQCLFKDGGFWVKDSENVPAVLLEKVDPEDMRMAEIGMGRLDGVQAGSAEEEKSFVSEQGEVSSKDNFGNTELVHGQLFGPGSDVPGNVNVGEELDERIEDLSLDASKNIKKESLKNFATSPCIDEIRDRAQRLEQILEPVKGVPLQGHPCKNQEEEGSFSHENREEGSFSQSDHEEGLDALKEAWEVERSALAVLEEELEEERNAAAIAASEAMAMISRLQEEKSAMQMEVAQFQRMSEEKAEYDQQAMSLLKEILFKREKEKFALEKEVELYRARLLEEKVDTTKVNRVAKENRALLIQPTEPVLLLKGFEDGASASSSSSEQILVKCGALDRGLGLETTIDLDNGDWKCGERLRGTPLNNCDADEDWGLSLDVSEEPIERAFGIQKPFLESSFGESNQGLFKAERTQQMQKSCEDLREMGRSVFATDDEETQFILERLWVLEEELQELRGQDDSETWKHHSRQEQQHHQDCTPVHGNLDCLVEESDDSSEDSNRPFSNNFPKATVPSGTGGNDIIPMHGASSFLPDVVDCSRASGNSADPCCAHHVDGNVSRGPDEETRMSGEGLGAGVFLPVYDICNVQPVSKQYRRHPWKFEASESAEDLRHQLRKPDLSPEDMSHGLVPSESKELDLRRVPKARRLFCSDAMVQSNAWIVKDSPYADSSWEHNRHDVHTQTMILRDERQSATEAEVKQLTMRLKALEADRELLKQTLESFKQKDTGLDLLQEIVQHLRELRMTDIRRTASVNLPQELDPHWTSSESGIPAVKKRRH